MKLFRIGNPVVLSLLLSLCGGALLQAQSSAPSSTKKESEPVRIAVVGDSTVSAYQPESLMRGWGQFLGENLSRSVRVDNFARSGASTKSFPRDRWENMLNRKPDYVLIQFGHNDSHDKSKPHATDAATDYRDNLRAFIDEARAAGAEPILVTSVHRRRYTPQGKVTMELEPYAEAMRIVAAEKNARLIDLHASSGELFEELGDNGTENFTVNLRVDPNLGGKGDLTHFTEEGARAIAKLVARDLTAMEPSLAREQAR